MHEGQQVDRYVVERALHEGEFSTVYQAVHQVLGSAHALKVQNLDVPDEIPVSLRREGRLQSSVHHRNVMGVGDAFDWQGRMVLVMEYVKAQTLAELLETTPVIHVRGALALFRGVVRGVRAVHLQNVVHRDIKPENILLTKEEGRVVPKLSDFGMAKRLEPGKSPEPSGLSTSFRFMGTPEYMAPEQGRDPGRVDTRADMFSLGCLLYELITGQVAFEAEQPLDAMYRAAKGDYVDVRDLAPKASDELCRVIARLLEPRPEDRMPSCDALLERLDVVRG